MTEHNDHHTVKFIPSGRGKAQCPPNPEYPNGIRVGAARPGVKSCTVELPYPAPECGAYIVRCTKCAMSAAVTAVGRADDPTAITVECNAVD